MWVPLFMPHSESMSHVINWVRYGQLSSSCRTPASWAKWELPQTRSGPLGHGCFACIGGTTFEIYIDERNTFLAALCPTTSAITRPFSAQLHHCGMKEPPSPQLWSPAPFHSTRFLTSQSFQSPGKWIFSLAFFPSSLPLLVCASCSCTWKFWRASLYKKYSSKDKGRCFPRAY